MKNPSRKNTVVGKIFDPQTIEAVNYLDRFVYDYPYEKRSCRSPTKATPLPWAICHVLKALRRTRYRLEIRRSRKYDLAYLRKLGIDHANGLADSLDNDEFLDEPKEITLEHENELIEDSISMHQCWDSCTIPERISQKRLNEFRQGFRDAFRSRGYGFQGDIPAKQETS